MFTACDRDMHVVRKRAEFAAERLGGRKVSKEEAMKILDRAEEAGLVHMSRNTTEEIDFLCNCDRWHCGVIQLVLNNPSPALSSIRVFDRTSTRTVYGL